MFFIVERYLPGLSHSDLLRGLARLTDEALQGEDLSNAAPRNGTPLVRYHGSTIVLADEACFCEFEARSIADVAEANRRAALPFDRIVPAVNVTTSQGASQ